MTVQDLLDKIGLLPTEPSDIPGVLPAELIGFVVRWNRGLRQWKRSTLADFASVSVSTVERVERGEKVSEEALDKIAQGLGYEAGYFTKPRLRKGTNEAVASLTDTFGNMEAVSVAPMRTHRTIREASQCDAFLIHRPEVPEIYDADIDNLREWLDLASFVLSTSEERLLPAKPGRGRRALYDDILACVQELERRGLTVLSGVMHAPQDRLPDWKVAIVSVTPKLTDPGAPKRRYVMVDRRVVALSRRWQEEEGPS
jgi:transcriptional regulator with XRE-family HTH domain